ncbi:SAM-dependent MidA family methyltransferase [Brockia lithotrophica]|uniref:SAM-dependent MidA family methyltransferase n=2 Tax=Brockia lithotrophica TaxID=933949 RepID=A0A660KT05_9BACL|nr:SAM-dependent MidA family methyltransferase [Brockia lithotrophica]
MRPMNGRDCFEVWESWRGGRRCIPFAELMEFWLYHPECGYYRTAEALGRGGDFFTASHVGRGYGAAWAYAVARSLPQRFGVRPPEVFVEIGAGDGRFLETVLRTWVRLVPKEGLPSFAFAVEGNPHFRRRLEDRLSALSEAGAETRAEVFSDVGELPDLHGKRVWVFAHELLDAFPAERVLRRKGELVRLQWCVSETFARGDRVVFTEEPGEPVFLSPEEKQALEVLEEGSVGEVPLGLPLWLSEVRRRISPELLYFVDYGREGKSPWPREGTLRAYAAHQIVDPKRRVPGTCDLTYDVPWEYVRVAARKAGFASVSLSPLGTWLVRTLGERGMEELAALFPASESHALLRSLAYLVHPEGMGERFAVLVLAPSQGPERVDSSLFGEN